MRSSTLRRRASYAALSTGLLAALLVPLTSASAAACPSWTDEAGDSTTGQSGIGPLGDANLDIVAAQFGTVGKDVVGIIKSEGLNSGSSDAGDEFRFEFVVAGVHMLMYADRTAPLGETLDASAGFFNLDNDDAPIGAAEATYDPETKAVTIRGPLAELALAVTKPVVGQKVTELTAKTSNIVLFQPVFDYDEAPTPLTHVLGTSCTLGGAPSKPAPATSPAAGSPAASPAGSAEASPEASTPASTEPSGSSAPSPTGSAAASPTGSPPPPQPTVPVPAPGCFGFTDAKGDARPGGAVSPGNDPDLDILAVTGRTSPTALAGHLQIDKLGTRPSFPAFTGHRFEYQFNVGDKVVLLRANTEGEGVGLVDGTAAPDLKVTAAFDVVSSQVVLSVDRASLATVLKSRIANGTLLTKQVGRSIARTPAPVIAPADTASTDDAARGTYTVGDNTCFAPRISASLPARVQTSDLAVVSLSLTTSDGRTAAGQTVTARVGDGRAVSARTDKQGGATVSVPVSEAAGLRQLVVRSSGSAGQGELRSDMNVLVERALLFAGSRGSGTSRVVTATLTDDDNPRRGLTGQRVTFRFGGRTLTGTTDRSGRATATVPAGSVVEIAFAGRRGFLTAAKVRTTAR